MTCTTSLGIKFITSMHQGNLSEHWSSLRQVEFEAAGCMEIAVMMAANGQRVVQIKRRGIAEAGAQSIDAQ